MFERLMGQRGSLRRDMAAAAAAGGLVVSTAAAAGASVSYELSRSANARASQASESTEATIIACSRATAQNSDGTHTGYVYTDDGQRLTIFNPLGQENDLHHGIRSNSADGTMDSLSVPGEYRVVLVGGKIAAAQLIEAIDLAGAGNDARCSWLRPGLFAAPSPQAS